MSVRIAHFREATRPVAEDLRDRFGSYLSDSDMELLEGALASVALEAAKRGAGWAAQWADVIAKRQGAEVHLALDFDDPA